MKQQTTRGGRRNVAPTEAPAASSKAVPSTKAQSLRPKSVGKPEAEGKLQLTDLLEQKLSRTSSALERDSNHVISPAVTKPAAVPA